ncbi:hypothetical protein E4U55_006642 [Claviceps digitariae]|nr:hypothetical protein E4U55_006642 [Claviceps digitariae]
MADPTDLTTLPQCVKNCLQPLCSSLTDLACICQTNVLDAMNSCVTTSCSFPEGFYSRKYSSLACHIPARDHGAKLNIITCVLGVTTGFCIVSRILFKRYLTSKQRLDKDDWTIMSAIPTGTTLIALVVMGISKHGIGNDIWSVSNEDIKIFSNLFFAVSILYMVLMTQIKLSLCFFYLNIFPGVTIRRLLWMTVCFHILTAIAFSSVLLFACTPFRYSWNRFHLDTRPLPQGSCLNLNAAGWSMSALNVASDLWLIAMPLTQVGKLNLHIKKKIGIILMFLTGALVTIISILRLNAMKTYNSTTNPTYDEWSLVWWSAIEICTGFICTSLPTMRLILIRIAPRTFGSERVQSQNMARLPKPRMVRPPLCSGLTLPTINDFKSPSPTQSTIGGSSTDSQTGLCEESESVVGSVAESVESAKSPV